MAAEESVADAISLAKLAVTADQEGHYRKAVELYQNAVGIINNHIPTAPGKQKAVLQKYAQTYVERMEVLMQFVAADKIGSGTPAFASDSDTNSESTDMTPGVRLRSMSMQALHFNAFPVHYGEDHIVDNRKEAEAMPSKVYHRCFWLMRVIRQSIKDGGYVTSGLYIPRIVWFQPGAKCPAVGSKIQCLQSVLQGLERVSACAVSNTNELFMVVSQLATQLAEMQNTLSKQLNYIPEGEAKPKKEGGIGSFFKAIASKITGGNEDEGDHTNYVELLAEVMKQSQFMEDWLNHYEQYEGTPILMSLHKIAQFFQRVICAIALSDMHLLLNRYVEVASESVAKLAPST